jgi:hypothetical protein
MSRHFGTPLELAQNAEDDATLFDDIVLTIGRNSSPEDL